MGKKKIQITYTERNSGIVTGSFHTLEIKVKDKTTKIILDLGAIQSGKLNVKQSFDANRIDLEMNDVSHILVSHPHIDHTQGLCQLSRLDFKGTIYMTDMTLKIFEPLSEDGIHIHEKTVEYLGKKYKKNKIYPYMDMRSRQFALDRVHAYGYEKWINLEEGIRAKFIPNGHTSGSAAIIIEVTDGYEKETVLYMSDTSAKREIPFTKKLNIEKHKYSIGIIEATYGNLHIPQRTEESMINDLYEIIKTTCIEKESKVLIPSFAFARSTNLAHYIKKTYERFPELNKIPIYMVSPLMDKCHKAISEGAEFYDDVWKAEMDLFSWNKIVNITDYKSMLAITKSQEPMVMLASSGMGNNGVNSTLLPEVVKSRKNTVVFCGYCAENTTGYAILTKKQKTITSNIDGEKVTVNIRARIENFKGLSSHASGKEIVSELMTAEKKKMKHIIIVHGDSDRANGLKELVEDAYNGGVKVHIPTEGKRIKLT